MKKLLIGIFAGFLALSLPAVSFAELKDCSLEAPESCFNPPSSQGGKQKLKRNMPSHCLKNNNGKKDGTIIKISPEIYSRLQENGDDTGINPDNVNVEVLQQMLTTQKTRNIIGPINNIDYCNSNSLNDGRYGNCTKAVFDEYLKKSCEENNKMMIKGVVTNADNTTVLEGVSVELITNGTSSGVMAITNPNGQYEINLLEEGKYKVKFKKDEYNDKESEEHDIKAGDTKVVNGELEKTPQNNNGGDSSSGGENDASTTTTNDTPPNNSGGSSDTSSNNSNEDKEISGNIIDENGDNIRGIKLVDVEKLDNDKFTSFDFHPDNGNSSKKFKNKLIYDVQDGNFSFSSKSLDEGENIYRFIFTDPKKRYKDKVYKWKLTKGTGDSKEIVLKGKCEGNSFDSDCLFPAWASKEEKKKQRQEIRGILGQNKDGDKDKNGKKTEKIALSIIPNIINIILKFISPIVVIMFIYAGVKFIYAGSDEEDITSAKNFFMYAGIGLAFIIMSYTLMKVIYFFLK